MPRSNNAGALRNWLRECPEIARGNAFGVDYLGDAPGSYALSSVPSELKYRENILGRALLQTRQRQEYWLDARAPYGADANQNLDNLAFFQAVARWMQAQNDAGRFPEWEGGRVVAILPVLSAAPENAGGDAARYRIRIRVEFEI
ncbi:MAG: hypothetical protein IJ769_02380 [Clostridia bacterium]|nr:hypothetical protein [Clostridia bacterium]